MMARLFRILLLSLFALACWETPSFAQRDGAPNNLCRGLANGPTAICYDGENQKANDELKVLLSQIRVSLEAEYRGKLDEAQKAWEKYRDLTCEIDSTIYFGNGSGRGTENETCLYVETRLQIKDLHAIYDWEMRPH